jgi:hypothetical protein
VRSFIAYPTLSFIIEIIQIWIHIPDKGYVTPYPIEAVTSINSQPADSTGPSNKQSDRLKHISRLQTIMEKKSLVNLVRAYAC